jgi:hypothetical protein
MPHALHPSASLNNPSLLLSQGEYCMDIFVTIVAQTAIINADLNATQISLPTSDMQIKKRVCFLKMSIRPKADISFSSCNSTCRCNKQGIINAVLSLYPC